jgi:hypothetical protein
MNDIKKVGEILRKGSTKPSYDTWLKDQHNKMKKLIPEYSDDEVFEAEKQVLLQKCVDRGLSPAQIAKLSAAEIKGLRDNLIHEAELERMDKVVQSGLEEKRPAERIAGDLLKGIVK